MTTTNPPETFDLGRHPWAIVAETSGRIVNDGLRGVTHPERLEIIVDATLPPSLLRETVAHELIHALWYSADLGSEELSNEQCERIVAHLAPRLLDLLEANPELVTYLTG